MIAILAQAICDDCHDRVIVQADNDEAGEVYEALLGAMSAHGWTRRKIPITGSRPIVTTYCPRCVTHAERAQAEPEPMTDPLTGKGPADA